jgi:hypothetical protein
MVNGQNQDTLREPANQGVRDVPPEPNKIGASTPYDFGARNLTAYGGLLPVATLLEKLGFQQLVEETLSVKRKTRALTMYRFVLAMVLACYVGFSRLYHLRFLKREPMLTGILAVRQLPPQCTFWRFLASLHLGAARQLLQVQRRMRQRVWEAANVGLTEATLDIRFADPSDRHDGAHPVRQPDGRAQELQPEEQGQEELPADSDVSGGNQGVRGGRLA